jgi:hypothetical protein
MAIAAMHAKMKALMTRLFTAIVESARCLLLSNSQTSSEDCINLE